MQIRSLSGALYKNTIYQSKLKLLAIFGQSRFSSPVRSSTSRFCTYAVHHTEAELSWLTWIRVAQTQIACEHVFPRNISWKPLFGVFGCFRWICTHICSSLGEKFRFKKSDKIVDTVTFTCYSTFKCYIGNNTNSTTKNCVFQQEPVLSIFIKEITL